MINSKLNRICRLVDEWCVRHNVPYDIVHDEPDLQSVMLFNRDPQTTDNLLSFLGATIDKEDIHVKTQRVRGGMILAFSLRAISEAHLFEIIGVEQESELMLFVDKIDAAFKYQPLLGENIKSPIGQKDFLESAISLVESQYKSPTHSMEHGRYNHIAPELTDLKTDKKTKKNQQANNFDHSLREALDGIATPTGIQPNALFKQFARALRVLGKQMGIGPLQDQLTARGISWKQSDDGQSIIMTIKNAMTKVDQPVARISYDTLQNQQDFETQLKNMLDFATGDAPGSFQQKEQEIQNRKKAIGDIARAVQPQNQENNESEITQQMNLGTEQEQTAAKIAAMPK